MKIRRLNFNFLIFLLVAIPILAGCATRDLAKSPDIANIEIEGYQGEQLGSINDFRENSIKGPQKINIEEYNLLITGFVNSDKKYTYNEILDKFKKLKKLVTLNCVEGWSVKVLWEGVIIEDILNESVILPDANTVIFHAYDGYTTSLPLNYIVNNDIILAYKINDSVLPAERGFPFQLVAESKWGYKWIKWITKIELSNDSNYKGYWEQRGFSNEADLNRDFLER